MADDMLAGSSQRVLGRSEELDRIDEMIERLATGRGSVVVLIGPPGAGLTTLLHEAITRSGDAVENVRAVHVPSGLLQGDLAPVLASVASGSAVDAVRRAAEAAGQRLGEAGAPTVLDEPRLIREAVDALQALSGERPLLVTVDNLPAMEGPLFNALTSLAAGIAKIPVMVVATSHALPRSAYEDSPVGPLWVRHVRPLRPADAVQLVHETVSGWVPHSVAATIGHRTGGNPGDIVAVTRALSPEQLSGSEPLPRLLPGTAVSETVYRSWWEALAPAGRMLVLGAACAAGRTGHGLAELGGVTATEVAGPDGAPALHDVDGRVVARDPRLLSAVHALAPATEVAAAHRALAASYPEGSPERDWHAMLSGTSPTPETLDGLVRHAAGLLDRGRASCVQSLLDDVAARRRGEPPVDLLVAGALAAVHCGTAARAVTLLSAAAGREPGSLGAILPPLLVAMTHRDRGVPHRLVASGLERLERSDPEAAAAVATLAARLSAEHGDEPSARRYLLRAESLRDRDPDDATSAAHGDPGTATAGTVLGSTRGDDLSVLVDGRSAADVAGWQLEMQRVTDLVTARDWARARGAVADLAARVGRCPTPLLRAQLAHLSVRLHLSVGEYRRAEEIAARATEERLPLHVPAGGSGLAQLALVALLRARRTEADAWLAELAELLAQNSHREPVLAAALHEALGLRARLDGDLAEAEEHYGQALAAGGLLPATVTDLVRLRWRGHARETDTLLPGTAAAADDAAEPAAGAPEPAVAAALALARAPQETVVGAAAAAELAVRGAVPAAAGAHVLELAADRVGTLSAEAYSGQADAAGRDVPADRHSYQLLLLRRARRVYEACGATAHLAATDREIDHLERPPAQEDPRIASLTPEELRVAQFVHRGYTNKQIATALYLSVRTVELRLTNVYRKLGIRSRRELRLVTGAATAGRPT